LALDTDLRPGGETEIDRYNAVLSGEQNWFTCICIAGKVSLFPTERIVYDKPTGTFFKEDHTPILGTWREVAADAEHSEVLAFMSGVLQLIQRVGPERGQPPLDAYFNIEENTNKSKIRITTGPQAGKYVGVSESYESRELESRDIGYSFFASEERAFAFLLSRAGEVQAALKVMGVDSELIPVDKEPVQHPSVTVL
jgi:hypothetical protein